VLVEVLRAGDLEGASSRKDSLVFDGVLDGAESIADSVTGLSDRVIVGALDKDGAGEGVLDTLNEGVLIFTKSLFVDDLGETHVFDAHVVDGVEELSSASEGDTFTIALFGATDTDDTSAGEDFKGRGVNTLLVDNDEVLVGTVADLLLELNDLVDFLVGECALGSDKFFTLVSVGPEEAGVDFGLLVFKRDVEAHDVAVFQAGGHIALATSVVKHETADKLALVGHLVLHVHELNHVKINLAFAGDGVNGVDNDFGEGVGECGGDLGVEGSAGDFEEEVTVDFLLNLEGLKELEGLSLGELETINNNAGVHSFAEVALSLAHEFTNEENVSGGSVADNIVLSGSGTANHSSGRVLDLHLVEEDTAIFGQLNLSRATNKPKCALVNIRKVLV